MFRWSRVAARATQCQRLATHLRTQRGVVDMRSDTVTTPTSQLRAVMAAADVGDDVQGEDPTVNALQEAVAALAGKESQQLVPPAPAVYSIAKQRSDATGTQVSLAAHCQRGDEVILGHGQHIFKYEGGGASALLGVSLATVPNQDDGTIDLADIQAAIRADDPHYPRTTAVCLENTHNTCGGRVLSPEYIDSVGQLCAEHGLVCHLDGARVFNAAVAAGVSLERMLRGVHSASICFSKGLGCPVGSVVVGDAKFIYRATRARKMVGGGMRQAGVLAAAGLYALEHTVPTLHRDHSRAKRLAEGFAATPGLHASVSTTETNLVFFSVDPDLCSAAMFIDEMRKRGVLFLGAYHSTLSGKGGPEMVRAVLHHQISDDDVERVIEAASDVVNAC